MKNSLLIAGLVATLAGPACQGPDARHKKVALTIDGRGLAVQWNDGPRREAVKAEMQREARRVARRLFHGDPMPSTLPREVAPVVEADRHITHVSDEAPAWVDGVPKPPAVLEHDLPRAWPIQVKRGETVARLATWAGQDVRTMLTDNKDKLKGRRWLKTGDRLMVTMSANQKVAFDRVRDDFQRERVDAYFSKRFFEKVVVYRIKRGEFVATAAKRYGEVPQWLLEEFNQTDFRSLHAGTEILIPVVKLFAPGQATPPPLVVVDEEGRPLSEERRERVARKLRGDLLSRARLALDDSNVFERGPANARPEVRPAAPRYQAGQAAPVGVAGHPAPSVALAVARDVIIQNGESLMHYVQWSGIQMDDIKLANPHLDPQRLLVGSRISLPLTDVQYVDFVKSRSAWKRERQKLGIAAASPAEGAAQAASAKPEQKFRYHKVRAGETAGGIARRYKIGISQLKRVNGGRNLDHIRIGQRLKIPPVS